VNGYSLFNRDHWLRTPGNAILLINTPKSNFMAKIAYLDCASGISGDMTLGALVDAGIELETLNAAIGSLGVPGCRLVAQEVKKNGFRATQVTVEHQPEHKHRHLHHILAMIDAGRLSDRQRDLARRIFTRLAEAEAKVHGTTVEKVHFHEVGAVDSIADIVGAAVGWDLLGAERIVASPVATGTGRIQIAHGECGIPAPATAELLIGVPVLESAIRAELTTPTGAAILAALVDAYGPLPAMKIERIGCGAGQKDLEEQANLLRLIVGEAVDATVIPQSDQVCVLETNLDNLSGELIGYCIEQLWEAGALDVYTTAIQMKKNRPGVKLSAMSRPEDAAVLEAVLFSETSTLGVRRWMADRHVLRRQNHAVQTPWGMIEGKIAWLADGTIRFAPEFESCRRIASQHNVPLPTVYEIVREAFDEKDVKGAKA
jgi:pyridinium-3,5-bisthiocarboxylic acid mononucleotide nickel chelatase